MTRSAIRGCSSDNFFQKILDVFKSVCQNACTMKFLLPYIVQGEPKARLFARVEGPDISSAAASAEIQIRNHFLTVHKRHVCVAVAHVDFTNLDRNTGRPIPQPQPQPFRRRRRRNQGGVFR